MDERQQRPPRARWLLLRVRLRACSGRWWPRPTVREDRHGAARQVPAIAVDHRPIAERMVEMDMPRSLPCAPRLAGHHRTQDREDHNGGVMLDNDDVIDVVVATYAGVGDGQSQPIAASICAPASSSTLACPAVSVGSVVLAALRTASPNPSSVGDLFGWQPGHDRHAPQQLYEADVHERVRELGPVARFEERQQLELAAVVAAVVGTARAPRRSQARRSRRARAAPGAPGRRGARRRRGTAGRPPWRAAPPRRG
jgi:hypothetical protein